jgi:hypothetical protein
MRATVSLTTKAAKTPKRRAIEKSNSPTEHRYKPPSNHLKKTR